MIKALEALGPFDTVMDVGGNVGEFAAQAHTLWTGAKIISFEPIPDCALRNFYRANGRWDVVEVAISDEDGFATLNVCENQPSASSMQPAGTVRKEMFRIGDYFTPIEVKTELLDHYFGYIEGKTLLKIDVEGHEGKVLAGAEKVLSKVNTVIIECQQLPTVFLGSPSVEGIDWILRQRGLFFAGVIGSLAEPGGEIVQFDGVWRRYEGG